MANKRRRESTATTSNGTAPPAASKRPDFYVWAVDSKTDVKGDIGAAWINADGTIDIKLNPFLVIDTGSQQIKIKLYPREA